MPVTFGPATPDDWEAIRLFLADMGWAERVGDAARFRLAMKHSDRTVVAREGDHVVGFVRAICDGASNGYISMLAVAPTHQRRGIGRELIQRLIGNDPHISWVLRAGRNSEGFWRKVGFEPSTIAMERLRVETESSCSEKC